MEGCGNKIGPYDCCTVVQGDCLDVMLEMPDGCVDLVVTDPPYTPPVRHYDTRTEFRRSLADFGVTESFFKVVFDAIDRILSAEGALYTFCNGQSYPLFFVVAYPLFKHLRPLIWDKMLSINGYSWRHQHELIAFGVRYGAKPVKTGDGDILKCRAVPVDERLHPAQKPEELVIALIEKSSQCGDLVVDLFAGAGTTLMGAKATGRHFFGCDINPEYVAMAEKRLSTVQLAMQL